MFKRGGGYILGGREGVVDSGSVAYIVKKGGIFLEGGVDYGRVVCRYLKRGGIFWKEGVDFRSVTYSCRKGSVFWERVVDCGRIAYSCRKRGGEGEVDSWSVKYGCGEGEGAYSEMEVRFWRVAYIGLVVEKGVYSGKQG